MSSKSQKITYSHYLKLKSLLSLQCPRSLEKKSSIHDEWLFITVHQVHELWFKQILFELKSIIEIFYRKKIHQQHLALSISRLERILKIQKLMLNQISVMETMSPLDFLDFRNLLYPSSGMESFQFRLIETSLGLRNLDRLKESQNSYFKHFSKKEREILKKSEEQSLFSGLEKWLERMPFLISDHFDFKSEYLKRVNQIFQKDKEETRANKNLSKEHKERNYKIIDELEKSLIQILEKKSYELLRKEGKWRLSHKALQSALMIQVYKDHHFIFHLPSLVLAHVLEMEKNLTLWKMHHALMVTQMIGSKPGTEGSSGLEYLNRSKEKHRVFSDLSALTPFFIPRSSLPSLPKKWIQSHLKDEVL